MCGDHGVGRGVLTQPERTVHSARSFEVKCTGSQSDFALSSHNKGVKAMMLSALTGAVCCCACTLHQKVADTCVTGLTLQRVSMM